MAAPHIYVLPPRLFVGNVNFGEVEFPIYFNFFIKKAFQNPDLRGSHSFHVPIHSMLISIFLFPFFGQ